MLIVFVSLESTLPKCLPHIFQGFYTTLVTCMNIVAHLDTNLMTPADIHTLTPESIRSRIHGSKLVLVVEQSMCVTIWGAKYPCYSCTTS